jgi:NTP pyrophosphatase (non-canonical NTP hydrolase)
MFKEPTNDDRAVWAFRAVQEFRNVCQGSPLDSEEGIEEAIGDLIADLLHLARQNDIDPSLLLNRGWLHFEAEEAEAKEAAQCA